MKLMIHINGNIRKGNITCFYKGTKKEALGNYRPVSVTSVPGKIVAQILLESVLEHMENKEVTGDSQHGFTGDRSCLTNFMAFYDRITALVGKGRVNDANYLDLCKVCDTVLASERHGFDRWTTQWIRNCLDGHTQSCGQWLDVQMKASAKCVSGSVSVLMLFNTFVSDRDSGIKCSLSKSVNHTKS